ncbi:MAG: DUF2474 family protein [Mesorhizobium sp.]
MPEPFLPGASNGSRVRRDSWLTRVAWFIALWLASIAALGAVAWLIRFWLVG